VKFVELPFSAIPDALTAGRIDAAVVAEPYIESTSAYGRVIGWGFDAIAKHFLIGVWTSTMQWASAHPDLVSRFAAVMRETAVWANKNQQKSGEILAKYTKIDPTVIARMVRAHYATELSAGLMQPLLDASAKYYGFQSFPAQELLYVPSR
jgi:NitT/TauT family transport system substrate-binding protein